MACRAGGEGAAVEQDLAQGLGLVGDPGVEGGQKGVAVDEVVLKASRPKSRLWAASTRGLSCGST